MGPRILRLVLNPFRVLPFNRRPLFVLRRALCGARGHMMIAPNRCHTCGRWF